MPADRLRWVSLALNPSYGFLRLLRPNLQQPRQVSDVGDVAEAVDHVEAGLNLLRGEAGERHERAVFGIDVAPGDAEDAGAFRDVDGARDLAPVGGADRHRRALAI